MRFLPYIVLAIATVITLGVTAADNYIEYKNEQPILSLSLIPTIGDEIHHFRYGKTHTYNGLTLYVEAGHMTNGYSYETGYKYKTGNWTIKGKYEGKDSGINKSKLQTEVRYTFNK